MEEFNTTEKVRNLFEKDFPYQKDNFTKFIEKYCNK